MSDIMRVRTPDRVQLNEPNIPSTLWCRGRPFDKLEQDTVAIVGGRRIPVESQSTVKDYARSLGRLWSMRGYSVVTGFAIGVDTWALEGLEELGRLSQAIAVLPRGINGTYPAQNSVLADKIVDAGGLMLSQFEPEDPPMPWRFPIRNNLVCALSKAVFVVWAGEDGGSMYTARQAHEMGLPVFVPPRSYLFSSGTDMLLDEDVAIEMQSVTDLCGLYGNPAF